MHLNNIQELVFLLPNTQLNSHQNNQLLFQLLLLIRLNPLQEIPVQMSGGLEVVLLVKYINGMEIVGFINLHIQV